jgi:hypothetical protein
MRKHERNVHQIAAQYGGVVDRRGNGHLVVVLPSGTKLTTAASPSSPDISLKNLRRDILRYTREGQQ